MTAQSPSLPDMVDFGKYSSVSLLGMRLRKSFRP